MAEWWQKKCAIQIHRKVRKLKNNYRASLQYCTIINYLHECIRMAFEMEAAR